VAVAITSLFGMKTNCSNLNQKSGRFSPRSPGIGEPAPGSHVANVIVLGGLSRAGTVDMKTEI